MPTQSPKSKFVIPTGRFFRGEAAIRRYSSKKTDLETLPPGTGGHVCFGSQELIYHRVYHTIGHRDDAMKALKSHLALRPDQYIIGVWDGGMNLIVEVAEKTNDPEYIWDAK